MNILDTIEMFMGLYLIWYALRATVFNYASQDVAWEGGSKDRQIYFGGVIVLVIGFALLIDSFIIVVE